MSPLQARFVPAPVLADIDLGTSDVAVVGEEIGDRIRLVILGYHRERDRIAGRGVGSALRRVDRLVGRLYSIIRSGAQFSPDAGTYTSALARREMSVRSRLERLASEPLPPGAPEDLASMSATLSGLIRGLISALRQERVDDRLLDLLAGLTVDLYAEGGLS